MPTSRCGLFSMSFRDIGPLSYGWGTRQRALLSRDEVMFAVVAPGWVKWKWAVDWFQRT